MSELSGEILGAGTGAERGVPGESESEHGKPDHDAIARRAHEISQSDTAGTPEENWHRAETELSE